MLQKETHFEKYSRIYLIADDPRETGNRAFYSVGTVMEQVV